MSTSDKPRIETKGLTKKFRGHAAVNDLSISVDQGTVLAFLGPNGAGKTTTIKMLVNSLTPTSGEAQIFGVPGPRLGRGEFERIGYVSENQKMHNWMTLKHLLDYCRPLYPTWDEGFAQDLVRRFQLPSNRPVGSLSRGMKMKASLVSSLAYRPEVLILDEPFTGLDAVVRQDLIDGILELTESGDWTIFLSSHDMDEVQALADRVAIIDQGRLKLHETTEELEGRFRRMRFTADEPITEVPTLPEGCFRVSKSGRNLEWIDGGYYHGREAEITELLGSPKSLEVEGLSLKEIYVAIMRGSSEGVRAAA